MATTLTYNGIQMLDVLTTAIDQEVAYDSTGVDPVYLRVRVSAEVTIHANAGGTLGIPIGDLNAFSQITGRLVTPRRSFRMDVDGKPLFDVAPAAVEGNGAFLAGRTLDINHGPRPKFNVRQIIGAHAMRGTFEIELAIAYDCTSETQPVSLRWWTSDSIDRNWFTSRTIEGRARVAHKNLSPHLFRNFVFPPLPGGFKRESIHFVEDPSGLELHFTIKDQEVYAACPKPATTWSGRYSVMSASAGALTAAAECHVRLEGPHDVSKGDLIRLACNILEQKLKLSQAATGGAGDGYNRVIEFIAINETLEANVIEATARIRHTTPTDINAAISEEAGKPLELPDYDPNVSEVRAGGTAGLVGILLNRLNDPCNLSLMPQHQGVEASDPDQLVGAEPKVSLSTTPLEPYETAYDESHTQEAMYLKCISTSDIVADSGDAVLPLSAPVEISGSEFTSMQLNLCTPHAKRIILLDTERVGKPADVPAPQSFTDENGIQHTLLHWMVTANSVGTAPDGKTPIHKVGMKIIYGLDRAPDPTEDKLGIGRLPYIGSGQFTTELPTDMFKSDLI